MDYEEIKEIIEVGDIIQIAAPYVAGVGQVSKLLPKTIVIDPYKKSGYEGDSLPETAVIQLSDIHMFFLLKPDFNNE